MIIGLVDLQRALDNDQIIPHFQPLVELRTGQLCGFEVLARWAHPVHGAFLPANLIALAEANGLIGSMAHQVYSKALSQMSSLRPNLTLSINVSPVQMRYLTLARQIQDIAEDSGFSPSQLVIEITESALLSDLPRSQVAAGELKELGCHLSLDDFGTGYSSLAHLQALPFDELKIDRTFVSKMTKQRDSRKIVAAIIGLGHSLGLRTVAEGIETQSQADLLLWLGCELGQGWHYGRPAPFDAACALAAAPPQAPAASCSRPGDDWAVSSLEAFPTQRLAQLQAIYDGSPVGLCFLDCDLRYVSINQKLAEMNDAPVAAHLGKTVKQMIPIVYEAYEPYLSRALKGEAISGVEIARPGNAAGGAAWTSLCSYQPAFDEGEEVIGLSISVLEISEPREAHGGVPKNEADIPNLGDLSPQVLWMSDAVGNNMQLSSQWVRTVPSRKGTVCDLGWLEALHVDDLKHTIKKMKYALHTGTPVDIEYRVQTLTSEWRWMRARGSPRYGADGLVVRWQGIVEDIHEKKVAKLEHRRGQARRRRAKHGSNGSST